MINYVRGATLHQIFRLFTPTWDNVESVLTYQLYGNEKTYCNTPSEIICMIGLVASTALALINFSLVYTGRSLINGCVVVSSLLGLYACRRVARLVAYQRALEKGIRERDEIAKKMLPEAETVKENTQTVIYELDQQGTSMAEKLNLLSEKVNCLIQSATCDSDLADSVSELNRTTQKWIEIAEAVETSNQKVLDQIKKKSQPRKAADLPDTRLSNITAQLMALVCVLNGDPKNAVCAVGLRFNSEKKNKKDLPDLVKWVIETLEAEVLPKVEDDALAKCQAVIKDLKSL